MKPRSTTSTKPDDHWRSLRSFQVLQLSNDDYFSQLMQQWNEIGHRVQQLTKQINEQKNDVNLIKLSLYYVKDKHTSTTTTTTTTNTTPLSPAPTGSLTTTENISKSFDSIKQAIINNEKEYQLLVDDECQLNEKINIHIESKFEERKNENNNPYILEELRYAFLSIIDCNKRAQYISSSMDYQQEEEEDNSSCININSIGNNYCSHHASHNIRSNNTNSSNNNNIKFNITETSATPSSSNNLSPQSSLSFYSLLNVPSKQQYIFTQPLAANNKPNQCTQPSVEKTNVKDKCLQLQLKWSCSSNVQEFCLEIKSQQNYDVIYRGHNSYFTTHPLEIGDYHFRVRATNRFGVGAYSTELMYSVKEQHISSSPSTQSNSNSNDDNISHNNNNNSAVEKKDNTNNGNNNSNNNSKQQKKDKELARQQLEEQKKVKKRDDLIQEVGSYLNQNASSTNGNTGTAIKSIANSEETLVILQSFQQRLQSSEFSGMKENKSLTLVMERLESSISEIKESLASYKTISDWRSLVKKATSDYLNSSRQDADNEQLEALITLVDSIKPDLPEQVKTIIYQNVIQSMKKKLNGNDLTKTRSSVILGLFAKRSDVFSSECCAEMESLAKQLLSKIMKKKKKTSIVNIPAVQPTPTPPPPTTLVTPPPPTSTPTPQSKKPSNQHQQQQKKEPTTSTQKLQIKTTPLNVIVDQKQSNPTASPLKMNGTPKKVASTPTAPDQSSLVVQPPLQLKQLQEDSQNNPPLNQSQPHQVYHPSHFISTTTIPMHLQNQPHQPPFVTHSPTIPIQTQPIMVNHHFHIHHPPIMPLPNGFTSSMTNLYPHQSQQDSLLKQIYLSTSPPNYDEKHLVKETRQKNAITPDQLIVSPPKHNLHRANTNNKSSDPTPNNTFGFDGSANINSLSTPPSNSSNAHLTQSPFQWSGFPSILTNLTSPYAYLNQSPLPTDNYFNNNAQNPNNQQQSLFFDPQPFDQDDQSSQMNGSSSQQLQYILASLSLDDYDL